MATLIQKIILDTNIYGEIAKESTINLILEKISRQNLFTFYGIRDIIRKEVRDTPKNVKIAGKNLRILLLSLYDNIINGHELILTDEIIFLSDRYYDAYKEFGGSKSKDNIIKDFLIVSCASIHGMDILVSNDNYTLLTENAVRSYQLMNKAKNINTPRFINYHEFKKRLFSL